MKNIYGLWHALRGFGIEDGLVQIMKLLYSSANSTVTVLLNSNTSEYFKAMVGCSPRLLSLSGSIQSVLREHHEKDITQLQSPVSIGGRTISNLRFADDLDLIGGSNNDLLSNIAQAYGLEVSSENSKVMVSSDDNTTAEISMNGQQLEEVTAFKYVGAMLTKDGLSTVEIKTRLATATDILTNLKKKDMEQQKCQLLCKD